MVELEVSVVIRTQDSADVLEAAITSARQQTAAVEVVVVDSGSEDGTLDLAAELADRVVQLPRGAYTPGGAINAGASAARAPVVAVLSSHCTYKHPGQLQRALELHRQLGVVATNGQVRDEERRDIADVHVAAGWPAPGRVWWGFSNHSCTFTRSEWEAHPFDEQLPACEDKEWAREVHRREGRIAYSPDLLVESLHRREQGWRRLFRRTRQEALALQLLAPGERMTLGYCLRHQHLRPHDPDPRRFLLYLVHPPRLLELSATVLGAAQARRQLRRGEVGVAQGRGS